MQIKNLLLSTLTLLSAQCVFCDEIEFHCNGAKGQELVAKPQKSGLNVVKNEVVNIPSQEMQYVFKLSEDRKFLLLRIEKTGVIEPKDLVHELPLVENSDSRIVAVDTLNNPLWIYILYPKSLSALYVNASSSVTFNESRALTAYAACVSESVK